ncbi:hypothetical protein [Methanomassiliicoccus luminyensis]|uniref:hypothetical protein n=1 Tax=Methanomassiliicoccus luminyensis TaxID=1080712 RepID=UPI00036EB926|nr:hypothetical protein [Methanomassiliicoccus luminyensis]
MSNEKKDYDVFADKGAVDVLLLVLKNKEIARSDVKEVPGNYYRLRDVVLAELVENKLLELTIIEKPYLTYKYTLTKKGKNVATKLAEIKEIVNSGDRS